MHHFTLLAVLAAILLHGSLVQTAEPLVIDVHRDASYGCCKDWIKHFEVSGSKVTDYVGANMSAIKSYLGVPYNMGSCHTGVTDGKLVESHVPAADILELYEYTDPVGAAVPGMLVGSLDMETDDRQDVYQVIGLTRNGQVSTLAEYPGC